MKLTRTEERRVENFISRYRKHLEEPRINNSDLPAGAPMYYYCRGCGTLVATLPESHLSAPPRYCEDCTELKQEALLDEAMRQATAAVKEV